MDAGVSGAELSEMFSAAKQGGAAPAMSYSPAASSAVSSQTIQESMRLLLLVRAYQVNGHSMASLDPLELDIKTTPVELDPALYGFTENDLDREFFVGTWRMKGFLSEDNPVQTLGQILKRLKETYCGNIGYEYMHIQVRTQSTILLDCLLRCTEFSPKTPPPSDSFPLPDCLPTLADARLTPFPHHSTGPGPV
tara:strand:+ start:1920 stop:2501 length:582 start_codon:yes stop_codon:yes gene_type:complete